MQEREARSFSVTLTSGAEGAAAEAPPPLLVYDGATGLFPEYCGFWSEYYKTQSRVPEDVEWLYGGSLSRVEVMRELRRVVGEGQRVSMAALFP